jgi:hypothetical protein
LFDSDIGSNRCHGRMRSGCQQEKEDTVGSKSAAHLPSAIPVASPSRLEWTRGDR